MEKILKDGESPGLATMTSKEIVLEGLGRYLRQYYSPEVLKSLRYDVSDMIDFAGIAANFALQEPAEKLDEQIKEVNFLVPANWVESLKQEHAPEWIKRRWPVKEKTLSKVITFKRYAVYPKLPVAFKNYGGEIIMRSVINVETK